MLKRAAILCDGIFVDTFGLGDPGGSIERLYIEKTFGGRDEGVELLRDREFTRLLRRPDDFGSAVGQQMQAAVMEESQYFHAAAIEYVQDLPDAKLEPRAAPWRGVDYKVRGAVAIELAEDLARPDALRPWLRNTVGIITPLHSAVFMKTMSAAPNDPFGRLVELAEEDVVDFGSLPWKRILELRRSSFLRDFRDRLRAIPSHGDRSVIEDLWRDLWAFARSNQPSPRKAVVGAILGNLPLNPLNPISVLQGATSVHKAQLERTRCGWLYFLLEADPGLANLQT